MLPEACSTFTAATHPPLGTIIDGGTLELVEILGIGGYGVVYRAVDLHSVDQQSFAVKCLSHTDARVYSRRHLHIREISLHQIASAHPGIVAIHKILEDKDYTYIVMDYATDHDLFTQILHKGRYLGDDLLIRHIFLQLIDALEYCHSLGIYHRDLKPENILCFDSGYRVTLTDFGLATTEKSSAELRTGSVYHMSPECQGHFLDNGYYSPKFNDVWSLGIILLNLVTGRNPWKSATPDDATFKAYLEDPVGFLPKVLPISHELNEIMVQTLEIDWKRRITLPELRRAVEQVESFYSVSVVFKGSLARCPWEANIDLGPIPSHPVKKRLTPDINTGLKSHWSEDSRWECDVDTTTRSVLAPPTKLVRHSSYELNNMNACDDERAPYCAVSPTSSFSEPSSEPLTPITLDMSESHDRIGINIPMGPSRQPGFINFLDCHPLVPDFSVQRKTEDGGMCYPSFIQRSRVAQSKSPSDPVDQTSMSHGSWTPWGFDTDASSGLCVESTNSAGSSIFSCGLSFARSFSVQSQLSIPPWTDYHPEEKATSCGKPLQVKSTKAPRSSSIFKLGRLFPNSLSRCSSKTTTVQSGVVDTDGITACMEHAPTPVSALAESPPARPRPGRYPNGEPAFEEPRSSRGWFLNKIFNSHWIS